MQTPERLALIGGSILLSSTLVFTLKSQASSILPKISHPIASIYDHANDTQKNVDFDSNFQRAQQAGLSTGTWGTSKWYIGQDNDLHVGQGRLQSSISDAIGEPNLKSIQSVSFDQSIQAPENSSNLLAGTHNVSGTEDTDSSNITTIDGLDKLDTSQVNDMSGMFANNSKLKDIDVSHLDTHSVSTMGLMFNRDSSLTELDVSHWDVSKVQNFGATFAFDTDLTHLDLSDWQPVSQSTLGYMFQDTDNLHSLDLSQFDTTQRGYMTGMFSNSGVRHLTLGKNTYLQTPAGINGYGIWQNQDTGQTLDGNTLTNYNSRPGTWVWQR